jgi:hypothetical protein
VADVRDQFTPPEASEPITGEDDEPVYVIDEWDDAVGAFRRGNVGKPESSLDESRGELPPRSEEHYAAATIVREATPVSDSTFTTADLDRLATADVLVRAEAGGQIVWATPDGSVAYKTESVADTGDVDAGAADLAMKGPVGALTESPAEPVDLTRADTNELDLEALPDAYQAALEADEFVIYGKASIEQWDDDDLATLIEMDALEAALDRFFKSEMAPGIISRHHQDVPVGRPIREHTLETATTLDLPTPDGGTETHEFAAGDTLRTHVEDGDGDGRPELWLVSRLANDTEPARRARLLALEGDLNGYSVTIHRNADELTEEGRRVTACDLHAVTLGTEEQIKNAGSTFDVAEFKSRLRGSVDLAEETIEQMAAACRAALSRPDP